ncbi:NupC/NupG family nucleoside CNT transporter [Paracraurococcus lichenis]|uniref:Nucleoside transporter C-terminal domain-containing protein n=1 Tax=Paracraurococcus lichenis TaxID=3064888 RepID=A0ABT9DUG5_9PROT|nr:nucleoside transporter C-terminal domain-containing protein [Paracraurococcus sp. LOR1-02]MDO9707541.1 nucleoside transporter C-terminal domain-containing protein [Paracraurococcus sp. LOR1-02]
MSLLQLQAGLGLGLLCLLAWACGGCRRGVRPRVVAAGLLGQLVLAGALLHIPPLRAGFAAVGDAVEALARATRAGTSLVFGYLGGAPLPFAETTPGASFILFFQALPLVLVVGALSAALYHWRVLPLVVDGLAAGLKRLFGLSGACNLSVAANVFVGMVEAPLLIRPWLGSLTRAELFVSMVAGLATISGNMLVVYATMIAPVVPDAAGQLLTASLIAAPASILAALLMLPESEAPTAQAAEGPMPRLYDSTMDALVRGTADGLQLLLGIMASLIVFVALVALANAMLEPLTGLTLQRVAGIVFWPLAWAMGIPAEECATVARSLGVKVVVNEFVSYLELAASGGAGLAERSRVILTYALCGFTNFASVGIMVTGMSALCPERRAEITALGLKSLVAASIACCMAGATVGLLTAP